MRDETDGKVSYFEVLKHFNEYKKTEKQIIMETYEQKIEIPFGAKDSELQGWTYTIPDGMEAEIKTGQIIVKKKKSQDEQIREASISYLNEIENNGIASINGFSIKEYITYLEKQKQSEWSEEDKHRCKDAIYFLETAKKHYADTSEIELTIEWLKSLQPQARQEQKEPADKGEISDGYHTFNELYYYRLLYNAAFFNLLPKEWVHKSKRHHDGEECFGGGWFIVMANLPTGQISNHYEIKDWDLFHIPEKETADKWDGHTPQEAAERLHKFLLEMPDSMSVEYLPKEKVYHIVSELINLSLSGIIPIESEEYTKIVEIKSNVLKLLDYPIEKKENPKSSDSIPSNCASDAKCENRWHKVDDSLPDNGRLVLAQDNLGNRLLARYDGEGNWEVSVYDNNDYYCQNTITKWCEIPSEKQKEQELNHDKEKLIKHCIGLILTDATDKRFKDYGLTLKDCLTWLGVQKEQKPETKLTGWVARDSEHNPYFGLGLVLFMGKPIRSSDCWNGAIASHLPWRLFPDLKWEDEPMEVEITIRKK